MIFRSNCIDCWCKYSTPNFTFSTIVSSSRPLICAQPVRPGLSLATPVSDRNGMRSSWLKQRGPRTHQAHIANQDAPELQQFIETGPA